MSEFPKFLRHAWVVVIVIIGGIISFLASIAYLIQIKWITGSILLIALAILGAFGIPFFLGFYMRSFTHKSTSVMEKIVEKEVEKIPASNIMIEERMYAYPMYTFANAPNISQIIVQVHHDLSLLGISFTSEFPVDRLIEDKLDKENIHLRVLLANPKNKEFMKSLRETTKSEAIEEQISTTLKVVCGLKSRHGEQVEIRVYDTTPFHSMIIADRYEESGFIQTGMYLYNIDPNHRPIILVTKKGEKDKFDDMLKSHEFLWNKASPWLCDSTNVNLMK